jgi:hypothetical protein
MAKRMSQDVNPQNANPRKTKKRLAVKKAMLAQKKDKKLSVYKRTKR